MPEPQDPYNLHRFVEAQSRTLDQVLHELRNGRKDSHWIWYIFPQIAGLGHSPMSIRFAINSRAEAQAYLSHGILGPRLRQCTQLVLDVPNRPIDKILGYPDDLKFRSSMTLFAQVDIKPSIFDQAFTKYFQGQPDQPTLDRLSTK
jgi:uncharacterized protein (DUF1810 family)